MMKNLDQQKHQKAKQKILLLWWYLEVRCRESWSLQTPAALPRQTAAAAFPATSTAFFSSRSSHSTTMRELHNEVDHKTSFLCQKNNNCARKQKRTQAVRERASERESVCVRERERERSPSLAATTNDKSSCWRVQLGPSIDDPIPGINSHLKLAIASFDREARACRMQVLRSSSMESLQMQNGILSVFLLLNFSFLQVQLHLKSRK
jgi:hypothetical protein